MSETTVANRSMRPASAVLFGCLALQFLASMHHPFVKSGTARTAVAQLSALAMINGFFHVFMIALALATFYALWVYASRASAAGELAIFGLIVAAAGTLTIVLAALTDGFFIPMFSSAALDAHVPLAFVQAILRAAGLAIQVLSKFAFTAYGVCAALFGVELIARAATRLQGAILAAAGIALAAAIVSMHAITPSNLAFVALLDALWMLVLAFYMWSSERPVAV